MATRHDPSLLFTQEEGWLQLGGIQALVRLPLDQIRADRRRGLKAAMFIAGYRGSPVGGLDQAFLAQHKLLASHDIVFSNGLNEDLAATAVWGTQMLHSVGKQKFDARARHVVRQGAGRGPQRRCAEARQLHAASRRTAACSRSSATTRRCKSSSLTSQSEPGLWHWGIPSIYPGQPAGHPRLRPARLHAVARFRAAGSGSRSSPTSPTAPAAPKSRRTASSRSFRWSSSTASRSCRT